MATASPTISSDSYSFYTTLHQERKEIRVLILEAGSSTDNISATLSVVSLDNRPKYEALSYAWGDPGITKEIRLCGHLFSVTTNLAAALRRIRALDKDRVVWVDALCINQVDILERNSQVQLMHIIYTLASNVLVWVGEDDETTSLVMDYIRITADGGHFMTESCDSPGFHDCTTQVDYIGALGKFLRRPYWNRIWTVQEMILAQHIEVICGHFNIAWEDMINSFASMEQHVEHCCRKYYRCLSCQETMRLFDYIMAGVQGSQSNIKTGWRDSLADLLIEHRGQNATDLRDKVYALLSLADAEEVSWLKPNYDPEFKVEDLYIETTWKDIEQTQPLRILGQALYNNARLSLPSWVVDWSSVSMKGRVVPAMRQERETLYAAAQDLDGNFNFCEGNVLALTAILVDNVDAIGEMYLSDVFALGSRIFDDPRVFDNWRQISGFDRDPLSKYPEEGR